MVCLILILRLVLYITLDGRGWGLKVGVIADRAGRIGVWRGKFKGKGVCL